MAVRPLAFAASAALVLIAPATGLAATGKLTGKLSGLPAHAQFATVRAVDARGVIVGMSSASSSGAYSLSVKPGVYVVIGKAADSKGNVLDATGAPARVRSGRKTTEHTSLHVDHKSPGRAASASRVSPPASAAAGTLSKGTVLTFKPFTTQNDNFSPPFVEGPDRADVIAAQMFRPCTSRGVIQVDTSPEFVAFAKQEAALQRAGRLNPATPFVFHPIKPTAQTNGGAVILKTGTGSSPLPTVDVSIGVSNLATKMFVGSVNDHFPDPDGPVDDTFITQSVIKQAKLLASQVCP
jgi:hypothetical protein